MSKKQRKQGGGKKQTSAQPNSTVQTSRPKKQKSPSDKFKLPDSTGARVGALIGHGAQSLFKMVTGFGDYSVGDNSLMTGGMSPAMIRNSAVSNSVLVRHREYLGDILANTTFANAAYPINPGVFQTFPWLSQLAANFEQYRIRGLIFEFKSLSSDAVLSSATNSSLGAVIMATEYNSLSLPYPDKRTMENSQYATSSKPSCSFIHPIECARSQTSVSELYVRGGAVSTGDLRLYDLGIFQIATVGQQAGGGVLGELWLTYEIEFFKPQLPSVIQSEVLTDHFQLVSVTNAHPLGAASTLPVSGSSIGCVCGINAILFPTGINAGNFLCVYTVLGTAAAFTAFSLTATSNCSLLQLWSSDELTSSGVTPNAATISTYLLAFIVKITGISAIVTFGLAGVLPTAIGSGDLWITEVNPAILTSLRTVDSRESTSLVDFPRGVDPDELRSILGRLESFGVKTPVLTRTQSH
jgi:hypothetical protein